MRYNIGDIVKRNCDIVGNYSQIVGKHISRRFYRVEIFNKTGFQGISSYTYEEGISFKLCSQENKNCKECKNRLKCLIDEVKPIITALSTKIKL